MRIVLDTLGGDNPPEEVAAGGLEAVERFKIELLLAGPEKRLAPLLEERPHLRDRVTILDTAEAITMEDSPAEAVRRKRNSSLIKGIKALKEGLAEAFVSPGNTGAVMAAATLHLGRLPGIDRPGIGVTLPTLAGGRFLLIDVGANTDPTPQHLKQFAIMGQVYMHEVLGVAEPKVGLLNIGSEPNKGNELARKAYPLLTNLEGFVGNVESDRILQGGIDVVVCDGFVGNILLKGLEGAAVALFKLMKASIKKDLRAKLGGLLLEPALRRLAADLDPKQHGGAPLLGVKGVVIIAHGHSDAEAITNAIRVARTAVENRLPKRIEQGIAKRGGLGWLASLRRRREGRKEAE